MIRVVLDTNIVVSGTYWSGAPSSIMQAIEQGKAKPIVSEAILDELKDVLGRTKFTDRLALIGKTAEQIVTQYAMSAEIIEVQPLSETVSVDSDDDVFLACALSGKANIVISGDPHLLNLKKYQNILILTANEFLASLASQDDEQHNT
jgi:uncharacterized protein